MLSMRRTLVGLVGVLGAAVTLGLQFPEDTGPQDRAIGTAAVATGDTDRGGATRPPTPAQTKAQLRARRQAQAELLRSESSGTARTTTRTLAPARVRARSCRTGRIALTFDDGPHPIRTQALLKWLTLTDTPATFFVVGSRVADAPHLITAMGENSRLFTVANHTWLHPDLRHLPDHQIRRTLATTRTTISRYAAPSALMRPPYGALTPRVRAQISAERLVPVLWTVDSLDWKGGNSRQIADRILAQLRPGQANIVLQHDGVANSLASIRAVPIVVERAKARGYCFVPLTARGTAGHLLAPLTTPDPAESDPAESDPADPVDSDPAEVSAEAARG